MKAKPSKILKDDHDNSLLVYNNGKTILIKLKLASENRTRSLGSVNIKNKSLSVTRKKERHLVRTINSYGFNHYVLESAITFKFVKLKDETASWKIPVKYILENGKFLFFKGQGFEKQIFISLEQLNQYKK
jgi:hypothetical protein